MAKAGVQPADELQFCTDKIEQNFSNYSSWHYRSKLLPLLYPNEDDTRKGWPIDEVKLKSELELVLTAAFTDPKDSSAWFYQRWLLGYSNDQQEIVSAFVSKDRAILSFAKAISLQAEDVTITLGPIEKHQWKSSNGLKDDLIWYAHPVSTKETFQLPATGEESLQVTIKSDFLELSQVVTKHADDEYWTLTKETSFTSSLSEPVMEELRSQLSSCEQLLEFEPDSKWTLLTAALLMRAIDKELFHERMIANLEKLKQVDSYRVGYYGDLISKWTIERVLVKWLKLGDINAPVDFSSVDCLNCLYYEQYYAVAKGINFGDKVVSERVQRKLKLFRNLV